jgi:hypothetical protein
MPYKKYYLKLRLTQSELDLLDESQLTLTQAAHMAIDRWQKLDDIDRNNAIVTRKHLTIDILMLHRTIGANKNIKAWMDTIDNSSLTASAAIGLWLMRETSSN